MKFRIAMATMALLVFGMSGVATAQQSDGGDLVFVHNIPGGPPVDLTVTPEQIDVADIPVGRVLAGDSLRYRLPKGTHVLTVSIPALGIAPKQSITIATDATTTVTATLSNGAPVLTVTGPVAPAPQTATPRPQTVTVPTRVETGAGGSAADSTELVLGGLAVAVAAGALTLGLRRRTTA